jgi:KDO2-lipid IV(A) lauroyltransferase
VVKENLRNAFPEKTESELTVIETKYFKYLADLIVETIKTISISAKECGRRMKTVNPELLEHYFRQGKSVIIVAGHYCNWEMAIQSYGLLTDKKGMVVYKPLSDQVFNGFFNKTRSRFGTMMVSMKMIPRKIIEYKNDIVVSVFASDQTPARCQADYFTTFLNQPTAVFLGIEKLAKLSDAVVVFYKTNFVKRGYYTGTIVPLVDDPRQTEPYEITQLHVKYLESMIVEKPEYWLWSHRRWKIKPVDVQQFVNSL